MKKPLPVPTPTTRPFWNALAEGKLLLQECGACGALFHYPRVCCPSCLSTELRWREVKGTGALYTWTIARRPTHPLFADEVPQRLAVVELDEGPKLTTTLVNIRDQDIRIGMRVTPVFEKQADGRTTLLRYQPTEESLRMKGEEPAAEESTGAGSLLTPEVLAFIGRTGKAVTGYPITEQEIRRYCYAVDDLDPRWIDPSTPGGVRAPPMFVSIPFDIDRPIAQLAEDGTALEHEGVIFPPVPLKRKLFGGLTIEFFADMRPGDVLTRQYKVIEIFERKGGSGSSIFVRIEGTYTNQRGEKVAVEVNTIICR